MLHDALANVLSHMMNYERLGRKDILTRHNSKLIRTVLSIMKDNQYVGDFKVIEDGKANILSIKLSGNINEVGVIKPRFNVKKDEFEKFEKRFLPAKDFGILIVSTPSGVMTHYEAKKRGFGGKLISFCY